jgi:hypothetical protein
MIVWAGAALLAAALAWLEIRRPDRRHRMARAGLVVVVVAALAALLRPPMIPGTRSLSATVILATPGTTSALLAAARDTVPGAPVAWWPDSVSDLDALQREFPDAARVMVTGWGLREGWWEGHGDLAIRHLPAAPPAGFSGLAWPRAVTLGATGTITGTAEGAAGPIMVGLQRPDGRVDSILVLPDSGARFRFQILPGAAGRAEYVLAAPGMAPESLRISVVRPRPPAVLVLESAPSFETTFLRRWLVPQGATVAIRTRVSRDRDRIERVNLGEVPLRPIRPELLARFDLVIVDGGALGELGEAERRALETAVRVEGLGLLVVPDPPPEGGDPLFPFTLAPTGDPEERLVRPAWDERSDRSTTAIPALPAELRAQAGQRALIRDPVGRVVAAATRIGNGRMATSLLLSPSRWQLEGEQDAFGGYWSLLFGAVARGGGERWSLVTDGPVVEQEAVALVLTTEDPNPLAVVRGPDGVPDTLGLAQDLADPARWWGRFWPRTSGWHGVTNRGGAAYHFDVGPPRQSAQEAGARLEATARRATLSPVRSGEEHRLRPAPLGPLLPFLVLVAALALLWAEGRGLWGPTRQATSQ